MADDKKAAEAPKPAPATDDQTSTGPAATPIETGKETETYYLKPGVKHIALVKGERVTLDKPGQPADLNQDQYKAMTDRFFTKEEYAAYKASADARAEGASALEMPVPDPATMEQTTPEAHNNVANEPAKGKDTPAGERGTPPKA
jgi:hypothetical protein